MPSFVLLCFASSCRCCFKVLLLVLKPNKHHRLRREKRGSIHTKQTLAFFFVPAFCDLRAFLEGSCPVSRIFQFCLIGPRWNCSGLGLVCLMRVWWAFWCHLSQATCAFYICFCTSKVFPEEPSWFLPIRALCFWEILVNLMLFGAR